MNRTVWHDALPVAALRPGRLHAVTVAGQEILVGCTAEGLFALDNLCTHAEARMSEGFLRGHRLVCPLHGGAYDVRTGQPLAAPCLLPLGTYPVRVVDGRLEVGLIG